MLAGNGLVLYVVPTRRNILSCTQAKFPWRFAFIVVDVVGSRSTRQVASVDGDFADWSARMDKQRVVHLSCRTYENKLAKLP